MNERNVPVRLAARPRDPRGYPIPFTQFISPTTGEPDFRVLDHERVERCATHRLCGLCGQPLGGHIYFIGGPKSAASGFFYDPPMHRDCALFSLVTRPHLARAKGRYRSAGGHDGTVVQRDIDTDEKVEVFALLHTKDYSVTQDAKSGILVKARLPWLDIGWWKDGFEVKPPESFRPA